MISTLLEVLALKRLKRAGWVHVGVPSPESVAAHSWGVAWLVVALCPEELDRERALAYAVVHDLAEVRVGDITPHDGISPQDKAHRERAAMEELARSLPHVQALWEAYERQADPEARFVRQLDRLDMALQAVAYAREGSPRMEEFFRSAEAVIDDPALLPLLQALRSRLEQP